MPTYSKDIFRWLARLKKNANEYLAVKKLMYKHNSYGYFHNDVDLPTPVSIHETCI